MQVLGIGDDVNNGTWDPTDPDSNYGVFSSNIAVTSGGGISGTNESITEIAGVSAIYPNYVTDNYVIEGSGGGIYTEGDFSAMLTEILYNSALGGSGGGIYLQNITSTTLLYNVDVAYNEAAIDGGGIYMTNSSDLNVWWSYVYGNDAGNNGGGIYYG